MNTAPVRKFAISLDPEEVVDFEEDLAYFEEQFTELGFTPVGSYRFRFSDRESTLTADLRESRDGYELWMMVQAPDAHEYRIAEIADVFCGYIIASSHTQRFGTANYGSEGYRPRHRRLLIKPQKRSCTASAALF